MADAPIKYTGALWNPNREMTEAIQVAAEDAKGYGLAIISAKTPVKTGRLKSRWEADIVPGGIQWKNPTPYAAFQELGTKYIQGRHMLASSLPAIEARFERTLATEVGRRLGTKIASEYSGEVSYSNIVGTNRQTKKASGFIPRLKSRFLEILSR